MGDYSWIIILLSDVVGPSCMLTVFICPLCCIKRRFHKYLYIWGEISWQAFQPFCRRNVSATKKSQGFEFVCLLSPRQPSIFTFCEKMKITLAWRKNFFHEISVITFNLLKSKILPLFLYFHLPFMIIVETTAVPIKSHLLGFSWNDNSPFPIESFKMQKSSDFRRLCRQFQYNPARVTNTSESNMK